MNNIPKVKLGIIAVSRDCFPIELSVKRRKAIVSAYDGEIYECPVTVENELDMLDAVKDVILEECNALVVFLGNFGPETPETLIAEKFDGYIDNWEIMNEVDLGGITSSYDSPDAYAAYLKAAALGISDANKSSAITAMTQGAAERRKL